MRIAILFMITSALAVPASAQLAGTYVINGTQPTGGNTFSSFADATAVLAAQGVSGPCEFLVFDDAGPFTESNPFVSTATGTPTWGNDRAVLVLDDWAGTSPTNRVTFRAAPGEFPVLDADGIDMGVFWGGADYVTLRGLEIKNATYDGISLHSSGVTSAPIGAVIDSCRIHDCGSAAVVLFASASAYSPVDTLIQNCTVWSCQKLNSGSFLVFRRGYVASLRAPGTRIVHNTFVADTATGLEFAILNLYTVTGGVPAAEVSNNVFVKTAGPGQPIMRMFTSINSTTQVPTVCESNCFFDTTNGPLVLYHSSAFTAANTLTEWQLSGCDLTSIDADPMLRDPANDDFHLLPTSPCRDASTVASGILFDAEGQPRNLPVDLGSDEVSLAGFSVVGTGCQGAGGNAPELDVWSWPFLGNSQFTLGFARAPPSTIVGLFGSLSLASSPVPIGGGCEVMLGSPAVALAAAVTGSSGEAGVLLPLPNNPSFVGVRIAYQGLALDASAALGFTLTNGIDIALDF